MPDDHKDHTFAVLTEVGIINQIATSFLEDRLPGGLIMAHFAVLNHLIRIGDGQTPLEIARALQVPKTSFTNTLAGLQKRGLVIARPNPRDRRSKTIWVTPDGQRLHSDTVSTLAPVLQETARRTPPGNLDALLPQLRALRVVLDKMRDEPVDGWDSERTRRFTD